MGLSLASARGELSKWYIVPYLVIFPRLELTFKTLFLDGDWLIMGQVLGRRDPGADTIIPRVPVVD